MQDCLSICSVSPFGWFQFSFQGGKEPHPTGRNGSYSCACAWRCCSCSCCSTPKLLPPTTLINQRSLGHTKLNSHMLHSSSSSPPPLLVRNYWLRGEGIRTVAHETRRQASSAPRYYLSRGRTSTLSANHGNKHLQNKTPSIFTCPRNVSKYVYAVCIFLPGKPRCSAVPPAQTRRSP